MRDPQQATKLGRTDLGRGTSRFQITVDTTEQIFNLRLLVEKHLLHQKKLYHNFIDFKKAFDRVWHAGLWRVLKEYDVDNRLIELIKLLYDEATSAVLLNGNAGYFFRTTVEVQQGCQLSPTLFNIFLETILQKALTSTCEFIGE